jgi:autotransporter-associated beta strand protein
MSSLKRRARRWVALSTAAATALMGTVRAPAASVSWDPASSGTGATTGSGTWVDTSVNSGATTWYNGTGDVAWDNTQFYTAIFGGTGGTPPFTVTIDPSGVTAGGLVFQTAGYVVTGGILTLDEASAAPATIVVNANGTIASVIAGGTNPTGVTISGTAGDVLTFTGANTYTQTTTVNSAELDLNTTGNAAISGNLIVAGGTVKLQQSNQIAGGSTVQVSSGTLSLAANSNTVAGLQVTGGTVSGATGVLTSTGNYDLQAGTISAILGGSVAANKTTSGTLILSGANTFSGGMTLSAGTLDFNNAAAIGTGVFTISGGTLDNTSGAAITNSKNNTQTWSGDFTFGGTNALNLGTGAVTLGSSRIVTVNGTGALTVGGGVSGTGFSITKAGTGTMILNVADTYTGGTFVTAGTLKIGNVTSLGPTSVTNVATVSSGATLDVNGITVVGYTAGPITINGSGVGGVGAITNSGAGLTTPNGLENIVLGSNASIGSGSNRLDIMGTVTGGGFTLTKVGTGYTAMKGTITGLTGGLIINAGSWELSSASGAGQGPVTINPGGTITGFNAGTAYTNALTLAGGNLGEGAGTLTWNTGVITLAASTTSGLNPSTLGVGTLALASQITGSGALTVGAGAGTVTLTGTGNNFSGGTTITGGTLNANAAGALGTGNVTVSGGTLAESVASALNGASQILTVSGGTANLTLANTYGGGTVVSSGTLTASAAGAVPGALNMTGGAVNNNAAGAIVGNITVGGGTFAQTGILNGATQTLSVTGGTANLNQANTFGGGTSVSGGVLNATLAGAVGGLTISAGGTVNATVGNALGAVTMTGGTLTASNTTGTANSGTITLNGGTLSSGLLGSYGTVIGGSGTNFISPGGAGVVGQLNAATLNTGSGTVLLLDASGPWSGTPSNTGDLLDVTGSGGLTIANGTSLVFANGAPTTAGDYRLIQFAGSVNGLGNLVLPSAPRSGITYGLSTSVDPGFVDLVVNGSTTTINGSWIPTTTTGNPFLWTTAANWTGGNVPGVAGDSASFVGATGAQIVQLNGQQHLASMTFNAGTGGSYAIGQLNSTDNLSFDNGAGIALLLNQAGSNSITAPLSLLSNTNVNLASGSTFTISGAIQGTGKLSLAAGTTSGGTLVLSGSNTFTGGIEVDAGTLVTSRTDVLALGNQGAAAITLNGGALSFTAGTTQITPPSGFAVTFGAGGGTINNAGAGTTGKVLVTAPNVFLGSGTFTKTGAADLQINGASIGFTGNVNVNGLIEYQNIAALGGGGQTPANTFTIGSGGELVASGLQIFQPITLNGGTLSANGNNNGGFINTVNVTAASTLAARQFQGTTVPQNFAINTLTGAGNLNVTGGTGGSVGLVTIGNATHYTGTITVGTGGALGIGNSNGGNFFGSNNTIAVTATSGGIGLIADGDGTGSPQTINFTLPSNPITFAAGNTGGYLVGKTGASANFSQAANKIIVVASLAPNVPATNTYIVTPLNGFGLELDPALTATTTYNVGGTQASNVTPGMILTNTTGNFGIIKAGTGTLQLGTSAGDSSNTFGDGSDSLTDANSLIDIQAGVVSAFSDQNLGAPNNIVKLDNTTTGEFLALGTFGTSRIFDLAVATGNTIGVSSTLTPGPAGTATTNVLTLNTGLNYAAAGNTLTKVDDGTLVLTSSTTGVTPTSGTTISAGALQLSASNQIGSGTITLANTIGASLQLTNGNTFTQALNLSSYGIQGHGALESFSGGNTYATGGITIANPAAIGVDSGSTLSIGSTITATGLLNLVGGGTGTISSAFSGTGGLTVFAPGGTWNITAANTAIGTLTVDAGTLDFNGAGTNGSGGITVQYGSTLIYDNSGTAVNNRNNAHTNAVGDGTIELLGANNATSTETFFGVSFLRGEDVFNAVANGTGQANITLTTTGGAFTHTAASSLSSVVFEGTGLGTGDALAPGQGSINIGPIAATFQGAGTAAGTSTAPDINKGILPWALAINSSTGTTTFATADATTNALIRNMNAFESIGTAGAVSTNTYGVTNGSTTVSTANTGGLVIGQTVYGPGVGAGQTITAINPGVSFTLSAAATATSTTQLAFLSTADNLSLPSGTNALSPSLPTNGMAINTLTLNSGANLQLNNAPQTLTIGGAQGGGILALDPNGNTISGGIITAGANELDIHTVGNLTISSNITGGVGTSSQGLTKGETGTLTLTGTAFYAGQTVINAGTLSLSGPNTANTIQYTNYMEIGAGATLNLNGNTQIVTDLFTDSASTGTGLGFAGNNGIVTGTTGAMLIVDEDAARNFTGSIQGAVSYVHAGTAAVSSTLTQNNTYTGVTMITGGGVVLNGLGQLSGTTGLTINQASLTLDNNTGSQDLPGRLPSGLAISLNGGTLSYIGRTQFMSADSVGAITAFGGANVINSTVQTTGVASAALTLGGLTRNLGATVNFTNTGGTLGTMGTDPTILINGMSNTTASGAGSILGGGFVVNGGDFAAYNATFGVGALSTVGYAGYSPDLITSAVSADNILMPTTPAANLNNTTINSLKVSGTSTVTFNPGQGLTLNTGGLLTTATTVIGNVINNGTLASGGPELFAYAGGTTTINSVITGGSVSLVKSGSGGLSLGGTNSYGGGTYVDQGTLTLLNSGSTTSYGALSGSGGTGLTTLGTGGITLDGGTLTQNAGAVIPSQAVTILGSGVLTLNANLAPTGSVTTAGSNTITVTNPNGIAVGQLVTGTGIPAGEFVTGVNPSNNTVTISTGTGVTAGTNTLTFLVNNTLSSLTFSNTGGTAAPTVTANTLLTLTGGIAASSINVGDTSVLAGVVSLNNQASPTITVNPINPNGQKVAPLAPTLNISAAIQNSSAPITVGGGGVLEVSGASNFTGGYSLSGGTSLLIGVASTGTGSSLTGPLGNGTFTIGSGSSVLLPTGSFAVNNNVTIAAASAGAGGNVTFDIFENNGVNTAETLTMGTVGGVGNITLPSGSSQSAIANTTLNVNAPQMTVALSGNISGTNAAITKTGLGTLTLNGNNSFDSGVTINSGTVVATSLTSLGNPSTSAVTLNGGQLSLHLNGGSSGGVIALNNNVNINSNLASTFIDVNNNGGAFTGNTILMGALNYLNYTGSTAPATILNITGGNAYGLHFQSTNLSSFTNAPVDINVGNGLTLTLPGTGFTATNAPVNIGPGSLVLAGSSINSGGVTVNGTQAIQPTANGTAYQFNTTGAITLGAGSTLQIVPVVNTSTNPLTNNGYTAGGLQGKYVNFTGTANAILSAAASSLPGAAVLPGQYSSDSSFSVRPNGVANAGTFADSMAFYNGLVDIHNAGTYTFQSGADDSMQLVIDGVTVFQQLDNSTAGQALVVGTPVTVNLSAGFHDITLKGSNLGSGGGVFLLYGGPDTAGNGLQETGGALPPLQSIALTNLSYLNAPSTSTYATSNYGNAAQVSNAVILAAGTSATIDGEGSDLNSLFASLTLNGATALGGSILTINNLGGQGTIGVLGTTTITAANQEITTGTGTLNLIGGVVDSGFGLSKLGAGTLILGPGAGTFTGPLNINNGFLQVTDPSAITTGTTTIASGAVLDLNGTQNVAGNITLNGIGNGTGTGNDKFATANSTGALMNSNAVAASATGNITIGTAATSIGGYGNISLTGTLSDGGLTWSKVGPDMLTLSGTNTLTAVGTVSGGILQVGGPGALGTGAGGIVVASAAALDLNGVAVADGTRTVTISGTGIVNGGGVSVSGGYGTYNNTLAALFNSNTTSAASVSGPVILGAAASVGQNILTGNNASSTVPVAAVTPGNGDVSLGGVVSGAFVLTKVGNDNLLLTSAANTFTGFQVNEGTLVMNGAGAFAAANNTDTISAGGSVILDNVGTPTNSRLGTRGEFIDGYLTILGNGTTAVTEQISVAGNGNNLNAGFGQGVLTLDAQSGAPLTLSVVGSAQPISGTSGTLEVIGTNLGSATGNGVAVFNNFATNFTGIGQAGAAGTANQALNPFVIAINSTTGLAGFASFSSNTASATSIMQPLTVTGGIATLTAADNVFDSSALATTTNAGVTSINSLTMLSGGSLTINAGSTLSLQSGGLLLGNSVTNTGINDTISGAGTLTSNTLNTAFYAHVLGGNTLTLATNLYTNGGTGFIKGDGGTLVLQGNSTYNGVALQSPVNLTPAYFVNGGTLQLAGGNQTLFQNFETAPSAGNIGIGTQGGVTQVQYGATLDLNGTTQVLQNLSEGNTTNLTGGTILNSNSATAATLRIAPQASLTWSGNISGSGAGTLNFVRDGNSTYTINSPQTYTGTSTFQGGVTNLTDLAALTATSQIDIRRGVLKWDNSGYTAMSNRLTNASTSALPTMYFDGGAFDFNARAGMADVANIGNIVLNSGSSVIQVQNNGGNSTVNAGTLTRNVGTDILFFAGINGTGSSGSFGNDPNLYFSTAPTLSNGIIGGWAIVEGNDIGQGGSLNQVSFATYDSTAGLHGMDTLNEVGAGNAGNTFGAGLNTHLTGNQTLLGTVGTISTTTTNSLTFTTAAGTLSYVNPGDTLALQSGGVLFGADGAARIIGQSQGYGNLTTAAGQQEMFISTGTGSGSTVNASIKDNGSPVALVLNGLNVQGTTITLAGNNTYTGTTYVNGVITNLSSLNANGGTAISGGNVIVSGSTSNGSDSATPGSAALVLQANNQINPAANVTLMGGSELNTNGFNTTINNLTITNDGSDGNTTNGPAVFSYGTNSTTTAGTAGTQGGAGVLTLTGTLSATTAGVTNPNNLSNVASAFTIPSISAQVAFTNATPTIFVDPTNTPGQIGLEFNGVVSTNANSTTALNKTGTGVLGIGGLQTSFAGALNVTQGTLAFGVTNLVWGGTQISLANGTVLDTRALLGTIGSLTGSGVVENYSLNTAGTLQTGLDNTASTFAGTFVSPFSSGLLNVTKLGTGTFTLTGASTSTNNGTLTDDGGVIDLNSTGQVSFVAEALNTGGTLLVDDSGGVVPNRLGTSFEFVSQGVATANTTVRTLAFGGGTLSVLGNASTAVTEGLGNFTFSGGGNVSASATGSAGINLTTTSLSSQGINLSLAITGSKLGQAAGPGVTTFNYATPFASGAGGVPGNQGSGAAGTNTIPIRPDIILTDSFTGVTGFATDTSGQVRPLGSNGLVAVPGEFNPSLVSGNAATVNISLSSLASGSITAAANIGNTLTINAGGGITNGNLPGNPWAPTGALQAVTVNAGGILATATANISTGQIANNATDTYDIHTLPGATLTLNAPLNLNFGAVKADGGTLVLAQPYIAEGTVALATIAVNGGTLQLAAGNNTLWTEPTATVPNAMTLTLNSGTVDLNGNSQLLSQISTTNVFPFAGGTAASPNVLINNSSATPVNFTTVNATAVTFSGVIENTGGGALSFYRQGAGAITLTSPSTFTGSANFAGGGGVLQNMGSLANASAINLNSGSLSWDDTGLMSVSNRLGTVPVNMSGSAGLTFLGREGVDNLTLGPVNIFSGAQTVTETNYNSNTQTSVLNVTAASLSQSGGGTLNFVPTTGTFGAVGGTSHFFLATAPTLANNIIGGWAVVNGADFAGYSATQGVGALGSGGTFPGYATNAITAGVATDNIQLSNTGATTVSPVVGITSRTINSLKTVTNFGTQITLNSLGDELTLATGGLLQSSNQAVTFTSGLLTAGTTASPANLYAYINSNTTTINSQIVNNTAGGPVTLVKSGAGTLVLTPVQTLNVASEGITTTTLTVASTTGLATTGTVTGSNIPASDTYTVTNGTTITLGTATTNAAAATNVLLTFAAQSSTYTGGTIVDQGTLTLSGAAGTVSVPGPLTINGGAILTETTNAGQIATTSNVTLNNNATLTLPAVSNTFNSLTFNDNGSSTGATLTIPTATTLTLTGSAANVITANSINSGTTPTIAAGTAATSILALGASPTISTSGIAQQSLVVNALTTVASGGLTINGSGGAVVLGANEAASIFPGGVTLTGQSGIIFTTGTTGSVTNGPLGTGTFTIGGTGAGPTIEASAAVTIANPVTINGNFTYGGTLAANQVTLSGPIAISNDPTITVAGNVVTETITGAISGTAGFIKAGAGALTLTPATASTFTGPVAIAGGLITMGNANALGGASNTTEDLTVGPTAALNLGGNSLAIGSLSGGGLVTNSGASQTLTIGGSSTAPVYTFSGAITAATPANMSVVVNNLATQTQAFSGPNAYGNGTTINTGTLLANTPIAIGSSTGSGAVTIAPAGILAGIGNITGANATVNITNGGTISAGSGANAPSTPGLLTTTGGNATATYSQVWNGGASSTGGYNWKLNVNNAATSVNASNTAAIPGGTSEPSGVAGTNWDMLAMTSLNVNGSGTAQFNINVVPVSGSGSNAFSPTGSYQWTIADVKGVSPSNNGLYQSGVAVPSGNYANLLAAFALNTSGIVSSSGANPAAFSLGAVSDGGNGQDIVVNYSPAPEPTSLGLLGVGAAGLMLRRRRRNGRGQAR